MNLENHARRELRLIGEEEAVIERYLAVVSAFAEMGHSGCSAQIAIEQIMQLLSYKPLSPLTDDPREWTYHGPNMWEMKEGRGIWQNIRHSEAFSEDEGKTFWLVLEEEVDGKKVIHQTKHVCP